RRQCSDGRPHGVSRDGHAAREDRAHARADRRVVTGARSCLGRSSGAASSGGSAWDARVPRARAGSRRRGRRDLPGVGERGRARRRVPGQHDPRRDVAAGHARRARRHTARERPPAAGGADRGPCDLPPGRPRRALAGRRVPRLPRRVGEGAHRAHRDRDAGDGGVDPGTSGGGSAGAERAAVNPLTVCGLWGAAAGGLGLYGMIVSPQPWRRSLAFALLGGGVFPLFGVVARRGAAAGFGGDPVAQALVITGVVVAFAATAVTSALWLRLFQETGSPTLPDAAPPGAGSEA